MGVWGDKRKMTEEELYNEYRKSDCKSFTDFLVKKITELKEELKDANKKVVHLACNQNKDLKRKINKAKELLNEFMRISKACDEDFEHDYSELIGETEQFLNEVEK